MTNKTYELYGSVLKGTQFAEDHGNEAYIPYSTDCETLKKPIKIGEFTAANRIEYQPMEGQDSDLNGTPTEQTFKRYTELARGGAGLLWFEAVSVCQDGKSNPYQLCITEENLPEFKRLVKAMKDACKEANGFEPIIIIQLNHSGRYAKPNGVPEPITAFFNPDIEDAPKTVASDEFLASLVPLFVKSALLAAEAGFDGVDIKACHAYLMSEILSAFDREGSYGGCFENRARLFADVTKAVFDALPKKLIRAARVNVYDGFVGKYSYGESKEGKMYDLTEANALIDIFEKNGGQLLNVTMGSPYRNPDVSRPYRPGLDKPKSDALFGLYRLWSGANEIKKAHPKLVIVNTGISFLGEHAPYAAMGAANEGMTDFVGFGRMSFAYPDVAKDILNDSFDKKKICVACGGCSTLKKNVLRSGCIIRNSYYKEIFREFQKQGK